MTIAPAISQRELDQAHSRLALSALAKIFSGTRKFDLDHKQNLLWKFFQTTEVAADTTNPFYDEYRANFASALQEAIDPFLDAYNTTVRQYVESVRAGIRDPEFVFPEPAAKQRIIDGLTVLKEKTGSSGGFFVPYPGMNYPRSNTHLCTGR